MSLIMGNLNSVTVVTVIISIGLVRNAEIVKYNKRIQRIVDLVRSRYSASVLQGVVRVCFLL